MSGLCQLLLTLTVLLIPAWARLDGIRIFLNASDLNQRFEGTGHTFTSDVHIALDSDLPSSSVKLLGTEEGKPLPPLPPNQNSFPFTVIVLDVVEYMYSIEERSLDGPKLDGAALNIPEVGNFTRPESSFEVTLPCKKEAEGTAELYLEWFLLCGNESAMVSFKLEKACSKALQAQSQPLQPSLSATKSSKMSALPSSSVPLNSPASTQSQYTQPHTRVSSSSVETHSTTELPGPTNEVSLPSAAKERTSTSSSSPPSAHPSPSTASVETSHVASHAGLPHFSVSYSTASISSKKQSPSSSASSSPVETTAVAEAEASSLEVITITSSASQSSPYPTSSQEDGPVPSSSLLVEKPLPSAFDRPIPTSVHTRSVTLVSEESTSSQVVTMSTTPTSTSTEAISSSSDSKTLLPSSSVERPDISASFTVQGSMAPSSASVMEMLPEMSSELPQPTSPSISLSTSLSSTSSSTAHGLPSAVSSTSLTSSSSTQPSSYPSSSLSKATPSPSSSSRVFSPSLSSSLQSSTSSSTPLLSPSPSSFPSPSPSPSTSSTPPDGVRIFGFGLDDPQFYYIVGAFGGGLVIFILLLVLILCCCCCCCCWRSKKRADKPGKWERRTAELISPLTPPSLWTALPWGSPRSLPESVYRTVVEYGRSRSAVTIHNTLKTGTYGCSLRGRLLVDKLNPESPDNLHLRIKMLAGFSSEGANRKHEVRKFLELATLMKGLDHINILPLVGVCVEEGYVPLVLYPHCEEGSVHSFLERSKFSPERQQMLTVQFQLGLCLQVAEGMLYLAENSIVHPDLALRNCFIDSSFTLKIADSALTYDLLPDFYHCVYGVRRPVRWAALETLTQGISETKSNVWSFAITSVEVFTLAELPYPSVKNKNILAHVLLGNRPIRPNNCPHEIYALLQECWCEMSHYRPGFREIVQRMQIFCTDFLAREMAEVDGLLEALEADAQPFMSPAREKKMMLSPSNLSLGAASESTISESDVRRSTDNVFPVRDGIASLDANVPNCKIPSRPSSAASPDGDIAVGCTFSHGEKPSSFAMAYFKDSRSSSPVSRQGSLRRANSPAPSPRTPVPVRLPIPPIAVRSETAMSHSMTSESTDASASSQRPLLSSNTNGNGKEVEAPQRHQETTRTLPAADKDNHGRRPSDPFSGIKLTIGTDLEDDFMAAFDSMLSTSS